MIFSKASATTDLDIAKTKLAGLAPPGNTPKEEQADIAKMTALKLSEATSKFETSFATAKKAFAEVNASSSNEPFLQLWQQEIVKFKAEVVQFGALALLNNPLLGHAGKRGKDLRAQLKSIHSAIAPTDKPQDRLLVGDALQKRMSMVLEG